MIRFLIRHWEWIIGTFLAIVSIVITFVTYLKPNSGVAKFVNKVFIIGIKNHTTVNNNYSSNLKDNDHKFE